MRRTATERTYITVDVAKSILLREDLLWTFSLYRRIHIAMAYRTENDPKISDSRKSAIIYELRQDAKIKIEEEKQLTSALGRGNSSAADISWMSRGRWDLEEANSWRGVGCSCHA